MTVTTVREVEAKFRVHPPYVLPDLTGERTGVTSVDEPVVTELRAIYWDTSDLRLAREGITVRHRSGEGSKDGWHLKLPAQEVALPDASTGARDEIHAAGSPEQMPAEIRELITAYVRTAVLGPVATLLTHRTTWTLRDAGGAALAELTDDIVSVLSGGHVAGRFREIEVEDVGGGAPVLAGVGDVLRAHGAVGGQFVPKVVRALGPQATAEPDPPRPQRVTLRDPARTAVQHVLRRYVRALMAQDIALRRGHDDAVHQMRVAARRLRSALKTFRPLLDPEWSDGLREELRWLAESLGAARDSEVLLARLQADLAAIPAHLVLGPVGERLQATIGADLAAGTEQVAVTVASERYVVLLERLVDAAWEPMTAPEAEERTRDAVPPLVQAQWERLVKGVKRLSHPDAVDEDWHDVRKKAKQVRYTAESLAAIYGREAKDFARRVEAVQEVLGEHQDAAIAAETLLRMATAPKAGPVAFTLGLLHARQQHAVEDSRDRFAGVWSEARRPKHRGWLAG